MFCVLYSKFNFWTSLNNEILSVVCLVSHRLSTSEVLRVSCSWSFCVSVDVFPSRNLLFPECRLADLQMEFTQTSLYFLFPFQNPFVVRTMFAVPLYVLILILIRSDFFLQFFVEEPLLLKTIEG